MSRSRHLLLDFGGPVLLTPFELRDAAARSMGVAVDAFAGGPFDPDDTAWGARERGEITEREYWAAEAARFELDTRAYMNHFFSPSGNHLVRPDAEALVDDARAAGRTVGVLTNDLSAFHGPEWRDPIRVFTKIAPLVDLSDHGVLKPDPRAYVVAIEAMGVAPGDIVFVDDHLDNVAGGEAAGMVSIWFDITDPAGTLARVRAALDLEGPP